MNAVAVITGVAGMIVSLGALTQVIGVSMPILAVALFVTSVLLLVKTLPWQ